MSQESDIFHRVSPRQGPGAQGLITTTDVNVFKRCLHAPELRRTSKAGMGLIWEFMA